MRHSCFVAIVTCAAPLAEAQPCINHSWERIAAVGPQPVSGPHTLLAFDETIGESVCLAASRDMWSWNGVRWAPRGVFPSAVPVDALAFDSARQQLVAFDSAGQTWSWAGGVWTLRATTGPGERFATAMAFNPTRQRLVLSGGQMHTANGAIVYFDDLWEWAGNLWIHRGTTTLGVGSVYHSSAFDPINGNLLFFGGYRGFDPATGLPIVSGKTWNWNGHAWRQHEYGPGPRFGAATATDTDRNRIILQGGTLDPAQAGRHFDDTWEFDGSAWIPISNLGPGPRFQPGMTYDPLRQRTVLFGGEVPGSIHPSDVWEYTIIEGLRVNTQPVDDSVTSGDTATFGVDIMGDGPISYRWRREAMDLFDNTRIAGAATPSLSIRDVNISDIGRYDCVITNPCGSVTTTQAMLVVSIRPCPGDADGNRRVDFADISKMLENWLLPCP